jgi:hypothetical protein
MGVRAYYRRLTPEQLACVRADPTRLDDIRDEHDERDDAEAWGLDIDKSWDDLRSLLSGHIDESQDPLWKAIEGGELLVDESSSEDPWDEEYRTFLSPEEVSAVATALGQIDPNTLRARYFSPDFPNWSSKKPVEAWRPPADPDYLELHDENLEYLLEHFAALVPFFEQMAASGDAVLMYHC